MEGKDVQADLFKIICATLTQSLKTIEITSIFIPKGAKALFKPSRFQTLY